MITSHLRGTWPREVRVSGAPVAPVSHNRPSSPSDSHPRCSPNHGIKVYMGEGSSRVCRDLRGMALNAGTCELNTTSVRPPHPIEQSKTGTGKPERRATRSSCCPWSKANVKCSPFPRSGRRLPL